MTSPSQLKYLDAMGIPVWVSRDLIIEESLSLDNNAITSDSQVHTKKQIEAKVSSQGTHSVQSILDSLDEPSVSNKTESQSKSFNNEASVSSLEQAVSTSINNTKVVDESPIEKPSEPSREVLSNENLLFKSSQHYVFASGSKSADWMVIGHSPETFTSIGDEPFAGEAGELLNNMLRAVGVEYPRTQAYLLNVVDISKATDANQDIQNKLKQDLFSIIDQVQPKVVLFVGQIAAQNLLDSTDPLIIMRSKVHVIGDTKIPCVVTYYPSYLLQKPNDKRKAWDDLKLAMSQLS